MARPRVAVIGAGPAGLTAAQVLAAAGAAVTVYEKSRGVGGRVATRRTRAGHVFDHGAPAIDPTDRALRDGLLAAGAATPWAPAGPAALVGTPGMRDLVAGWAAGLDIRFGAEARAAARGRAGWTLTFADGATAAADAVVYAIPAPQAAALFAEAAPALHAVEMDPCWALLAAFDAPHGDAAALIRPTGGPFTLAIRNSAKPGRPPAPETWVAHAAPGWTRPRLEREKDEMAAEMLPHLAALLGSAARTPVYLAAHRWRHARTAQPLNEPALSFGDGRLTLAGDWCLGPDIEHAVASGRAAAAIAGRALGLA